MEIKHILDFIDNFLSNDYSGHDTQHAIGVYHNALQILKTIDQPYDLKIIIYASLLHDVIDDKICDNQKQRLSMIEEFLNNYLNKQQIDKILFIITNMSYSKNLDKQINLSIEGKIVQDADRLDSLGAIGIARTFTYGGNKKQILYDPKIPPRQNLNVSNYRNKSTTINHFYEKLIKLPKLMNTPTARKIAEERWNFMDKFLKQFSDELNEKK